MENIHQQEKLPITENQIKEFLGWSKKFYGKGKTVKVGPGETETTFTSYEHLGKMCINAKNVLMNTIRIYNPKGICIEVFHDNSNTLGRTLAEDGKLDQKKLEQDLKWFKDCFPPLKERISKRIHNIFADK